MFDLRKLICILYLLQITKTLFALSSEEQLLLTRDNQALLELSIENIEKTGQISPVGINNSSFCLRITSNWKGKEYALDFFQKIYPTVKDLLNHGFDNCYTVTLRESSYLQENPEIQPIQRMLLRRNIPVRLEITFTNIQNQRKN